MTEMKMLYSKDLLGHAQETWVLRSISQAQTGETQSFEGSLMPPLSLLVFPRRCFITQLGNILSATEEVT